MRKINWQHTHKISIIGGVYKYLFLLIIPVARGLISAVKGGGIVRGFTIWLSGAWFDVVVILLIVLLGFLQWYLTLYVYNDEGITICRGIFLQKQAYIPKERVVSLSIVKPFYLKPFGAVQLRVDTPAGSFKKADCTITVSKEEAERIMELRVQEDSGLFSRTYTSKNIHIILLSLITSNSFGGIIFIATLINQSGQILGEEFSTRIFGTFEQWTRYLAFGIPPMAAFLAYLLFFGWSISCVVNMIRHKNFTVRRDDESLHISSGIFTNRIYDLYNTSISYVDIRQSVMTKILGIYSIYIYAVGYGKDKTDVSVLVPAVTKKELEASLALLLPELQITSRQAKPNLGSIFKFIIEPLWACTLIPLIVWLVRYIYPTWTQLIYFLGFMAMVPAIWFMIVRLMDFTTSGISVNKPIQSHSANSKVKGRRVKVDALTEINENSMIDINENKLEEAKQIETNKSTIKNKNNVYTLRYSSGYYIHTVIIPQSKITVLSIRQSILQKGDNKCDVIIYSYSEMLKRHHCKNLDRNTVFEIFGTEGGN